jgi:pyruvate kinase
MLLGLLKGGMNIARINLSHCSYEFAENAINTLREIEQGFTVRSPVAIWIDMNGPKVR